MYLIVVIICVGSVLGNILLTALVFKLYTEYCKDVSMRKRKEGV